MLVDVTFDGVALAKGANARPEGNHGWFVEVEQPMPVGTLLALSGETQATVRVAHVVEGVGAGMMLVALDAKVETKPVEVKPAESKPVEAKAAEAKPAEAKPAESKPVEAKAVEAKKSDDDEADGNGSKGTNGTSKKRKRTKTNPSI